MSLADAEILALHRAIVAIPSVTGEESAVADFLEAFLRARGQLPERIGNSLLLMRGEGPLLLLDTHIDTVPAGSSWTRDPHAVEVLEGRVHGLGANDAKASVAAMVAAFLALDSEPLPCALGLALVEGEETRGTGTEAVLAALAERGCRPAAAVIGEPTNLDLAVAQKGLLILRLVAAGDACHAANARELGARNAIAHLARAVVALEDIDLGPDHPLLGAMTCEPTVLAGGAARNALPGEASVVLDLRSTPALEHAALVERLRAGIAGVRVEVLSDRLVPCETHPDAPLVRAARRARPQSVLYGSRTMSDMFFLRDVPAIKCGPGRSERSHTPDEYVFESEVLAGACFYTEMVRNHAAAIAAE